MSALSLQVAGIRLGLRTVTRLAGQDARSRYRGFFTRGRPRYRLALEEARHLGSSEDASVKDQDGSLRYRSRRLAWRLDLATRTGSSQLRDSAQNLDCLLRLVYGSLVSRGQGLTLHAACLSWKGRAQLFVGPSGAGKTTISRALETVPGIRRLSDELVVVKRTTSGFRAFSTPFWGEFRLPRNNGSAMLERVYFLAPPPRAGEATRVASLTTAEAQRRMLKCLVCFERSNPVLERSWDLVLEMLASRPCAELAWSKAEAPEALVRRLWGS